MERTDRGKMGKPIILAENILERATTLTATNTAVGFDVRNILDRRQYTFWQATSSGTRFITADMGVPVPADAFGLIGHNFGIAGTQITLQGSTDGTTWTDVVAQFSLTNNKAILRTFTSLSRRHWRLRIITTTSIPFLAVFFLGRRLEFPRYVMGEFDPQPEQIHATSAKSKAGYPLGAIVRYIRHNIHISFQNLTDAWVRTQFLPIWNEHLSQLKPIFWAWNLEDFPADVYFVSLPDNFSLSIPYNPVRRNMALQFEGIKE